MRKFVFITMFTMCCCGAILYQNVAAKSSTAKRHANTLPTVVPTATGGATIPTTVPTPTDDGAGTVPTPIATPTTEGSGTPPPSTTPPLTTPRPTATETPSQTLILTISADKERVVPGTTVVFTLSISNTGNAPVENVIMRAVVPDHTTLNAKYSSSGWDEVPPTTLAAARRINPCFNKSPAGTVCDNTITRIGTGEVASRNFAVKLDLDVPFGLNQIPFETAINSHVVGGESNTVTIAIDIATGTRAFFPLFARSKN